MSSWPSWMVASGVILSTSPLLTWDQCSNGLQDCLRGLGIEGPEHYVFQYDFQQQSEDPGSHSDRPSWLPSFAELRSQDLPQCSSLSPPVDLDLSWRCLWRKVVNAQTNAVLENAPGPHCHLDFASPLDLRVQYWGLPNHFLQLLSVASSDGPLLRLDSEGNPSATGGFWVARSELLDKMEDGLLDLTAPEVGSESDLRRCATNLCLMTKQAHQSDPRHLDFAELFSPPRVTPVASQLGLRTDHNQIFDLTAGWDVRRKEHRQRFRDFRRKRKPKMLMESPECKAFTPLRHINHSRMDPEEVRRGVVEGTLMWDFSLENAEAQMKDHLYFGLEHPERAASWSLPQTQSLLQHPDVAVIVFDMCQWGLSVTSDGALSQKPTRIATNNPWLAIQLANAQCPGDHIHRHLIGGLPALAQEYPAALCHCIAESAQAVSLNLPTPSFLMDSSPQTFFGEEPEHDPELSEDHSSPQQDLTSSENSPQVTEAQKRLIQRVHVNTGHPPRDRFLRAMRAAGALPQVLKYIKEEHQCPDCQVRQRPDTHRKTQFPRTFSFNKILCIDVFYLKYREQNLAILNMIDLGSNLQVAIRLPVAENTHGGTPTSQTAWHYFVTSWIRYFGAPQLVISDSGSEFRGAFERGLEQMGIMQHLIHPDSPWENGTAERHGGWLKSRMEKELQSGKCIVASLADLDELLSSVTSVKNSWLNRGGYTPSQLVFGHLPRVPGELLAEDDLGRHGLLDAFDDPLEIDDAAGEYRRRHKIRERARQLALCQHAREAALTASKAAYRPDRQFTPGQWVYVFRRAKATQDLHLRDRWVGPGIVILANNSTVYVGMRARLWRCSTEQLRPALPSEIMGKDLAADPGLASLLHKVISGHRSGAVDVAREGAPPPAARSHPVESVGEGVQIAGSSPSDGPPLPPDQPSSAPDAAQPMPPGFVPSPAAPASMNVPQEPAPIPVAAIPHAHRSNVSSRRSSLQEPASEPSTTSHSPPLPGLDLPPGLSPIPEADLPLSSEEPPAKVQRIRESDAPSADPASSSASSTPAVPASSAEVTRAPGTPVRHLLDRIPRDRSPRRTSRPSLTPSEELTGEGRVAQQVEEFNELTDDPALFEQEGWSGTFFNYAQGDQQLGLEADGSWTFVAKRNDEISLKDLSQEEKKLFDASDALEWDAILKTKAVRVISGKEAERLRKQFPDRILSSRMVRRKKPQPELHSWKAKSRWCLHGHADPDTGMLVTYAPTPQSEGLMLFLQTALNFHMMIAFADVKNAFCQSLPLKRSRGPLYAEPCEGLHLPPGSLICIDVPVYGLDDAPASWRHTVASFLTADLKFERNLVEPCWFTYHDPKTHQCLAQILVEVDDFVVAATKEFYPVLKDKMQERFQFGKWELGSAEYAGRRIQCLEDTILVDQYKYIYEQIHPIVLPKGRRQDLSDPLREDEFQALRSLIFKINWVARETRPDAAGLASIMASKLKGATVSDVCMVNKYVNHLRSTADRPLKLWQFDPTSMCFIVCSDAGGINSKGVDLVDSDGLPSDATQGAWLVLAAEKLPHGRQQVRASPIAWRSSKLKRKVFSTYGGETQAMLQGVNEVDWLQVMYRDATAHDVQLANWRNSLSPHMLVMRGECSLGGRQQQCSVTDAKSLFDCLLREHPTGKQDRKSALELAIVLKDLQETKSMIRWVPHQKMVVDCLTKEDPLRANDALHHFLKTGVLSLVDVDNELAARKVDPAYRRRSHQASRARLLDEYQENFIQWVSTLVNNTLGDCQVSAVETNSSLDQC